MTLPTINLPTRPKALRADVQPVADGRFHVDAGGDVATIEIFDVIGLEVTPTRFASELRAIGNRPVRVQINSPGGDFFDGVAIYNLLRQHQQPVTVQVLGVAASAASIIAMAGERVEMARNAQLMIHRVWSVAVGNSADMRAAAEILDRLDASLAETYAMRTGLKVDRIAAMMSVESWLSAEVAMTFGFADALLDRDADPQLQTVENSAPQTRRALENRMRQLGFSKAAAAKVAAGGWPALEAQDSQLDLSAIADCLAAQRREISALFPKG